MLKDIQEGSISSLPGIIYGSVFKDVNGIAYFCATTYGNPGPMNQKFSLFASDGTTGGTLDVYDDPVLNEYITIHTLTNVNGTLYFVPQNTEQILYKTNGTLATTIGLDLIPGQNDYASIALCDGESLFLGLNGPGIGVEPYRYTVNGIIKESIVNEEASHLSVTVYPNPAHEMITVNIESDNIKASYLVQVLNDMGQPVKTFNIEGTSATFDLFDLPQGVYELLIISGQKILTIKKILIQ